MWNLSQECPEPGMNLVTQPGIQHWFLKVLVLNSVTKNTVLQVKTLRCNLNFYCREHAEGHMQPKGCLYTGVLVLLTSSSLSGCASPANHKFLSPAALFQPPLVALGRHPVQVHETPLPWALSLTQAEKSAATRMVWERQIWVICALATGETTVPVRYFMVFFLEVQE